MGKLLEFEERNYINDHTKLARYAQDIEGHLRFSEIKGAEDLIESIISLPSPLEKNIALLNYKIILGEIAEDISLEVSRFGSLAMKLLAEYEESLSEQAEDEKLKKRSAWRYEQ